MTNESIKQEQRPRIKVDWNKIDLYIALLPWFISFVIAIIYAFEL